MNCANFRMTRYHVNQKFLSLCTFHEPPPEDALKVLLGQAEQSGRTQCHIPSDFQLEHESSPQSSFRASERIQKLMIESIDLSMDALESFAIAFSQRLDSKLKIVVTPPGFAIERSDIKLDSSSKLVYRGRVSTKDWSLVLCGSSGILSYYLVESKKLLGTQIADIEPLFILNAHLQNSLACWTYTNELLLPQNLNSLNQRAFSALIKKCCSEKQDTVELCFNKDREHSQKDHTGTKMLISKSLHKNIEEAINTTNELWSPCTAPEKVLAETLFSHLSELEMPVMRPQPAETLADCFRSDLSAEKTNDDKKPYEGEIDDKFKTECSLMMESSPFDEDRIGKEDLLRWNFQADKLIQANANARTELSPVNASTQIEASQSRIKKNDALLSGSLELIDALLAELEACKSYLLSYKEFDDIF